MMIIISLYYALVLWEAQVKLFESYMMLSVCSAWREFGGCVTGTVYSLELKMNLCVFQEVQQLLVSQGLVCSVWEL